MTVCCLALWIVGRALFKVNIPLALNLFISAAVGAVVGGFGIPWRHLIEGPMYYIYINLVIFTALIMLQVMKENGQMEAIAWDILVCFRQRPFFLFMLLMLMVYFPGMVTGVGAAAVLSTGVIVAVILRAVGLPPLETGAMLAVWSTFGAAAPPVNLPALIISGGLNMPFDGFTQILLVLAVPPGLFAFWYLGYKYFKVITPEEINRILPVPQRAFLLQPYLPILTILVIFLAISFFPRQMPDLVSPLVFMIGALVAFASGRRINFFMASSRAMGGRLFGVVAVFFVVGSVVQVMTLTGVKGYLVISIFTLAAVSPVLLYLMMGFGIPLLGGTITHLGVSAVLAVPFAFALLTSNTIVIVSCLAMFCMMSQIIPPSALGGYTSQDVVGLPSYTPILKRCTVPALVAIGWTIVVMIFAKQFAEIFVPY
jgi:TRAP-type C4-dicarboxylate transport system permease large subunit